MPTPITEEQKIHDQWYVEAKKMTAEKLPEFIRKLTEDYGHDYGTICHAVAAAGIAAMWAVERSPMGGITGFQASCVIWSVIEKWGSFGEGPKRIVTYENMLYPQYDHKFEKTISAETWKWIQAQAEKKLEETSMMHDEVRAHLESIVAGQIPFGYTVKED